MLTEPHNIRTGNDADVATLSATNITSNVDFKPETLFFHREWTCFIKFNNVEWTVQNFQNVYTIKTIKDFWSILNNIPESLTGISNIFFMENENVPLWEANQDLWRGGGCWSTIIKGTNWIVSMKEICMAVMGETKFDDAQVKGICVVPVSKAHCIIKLWSTVKCDTIGHMLKESLECLECCQPRFKSFVC